MTMIYPFANISEHTDIFLSHKIQLVASLFNVSTISILSDTFAISMISSQHSIPGRRYFPSEKIRKVRTSIGSHLAYQR